MDNYPFVSIVVPTYNRPKLLSECIISLVRQTYPQDRFEIIVVDDATDCCDLREEMKQYFKASISFRLITREKNHGPGASRQTGLESARGELVAFVDDDSTYHPSWLQELVKSLGNHAGVGGRIDVRDDYPFFEKLLIKSLSSGRAKVREGRTWRVAGNNSLFRKTVLESLNGFLTNPSSMCEDLELNFRIQRAKLSLVFAPDAISYHHQKGNLRELIKKRIHAGFEHTQLFEIYPEQYPRDWKSLSECYHFNPASILTPPYCFVRGFLDFLYAIPSWLGVMLILGLYKIGVDEQCLLQGPYMSIARWSFQQINRQICDLMVIITRLRRRLSLEKKFVPIYGYNNVQSC